MPTTLPKNENAGIDYDSHGSESSLKLLRAASTSLANDSASSPKEGSEFIIDAKSFIATDFLIGITWAIATVPSAKSIVTWSLAT
jgi:hypothetical protein